MWTEEDLLKLLARGHVTVDEGNPVASRFSDYSAGTIHDSERGGLTGIYRTDDGLVRDEFTLQRAIIRWRDRHIEYEPKLGQLFAIPNGGHRTKAAAGKAKAEGATAGVPDLFLSVSRRGVKGELFHGLYVELKHDRPGRKGRLSEKQREMGAALSAEGYAVVVCRTYGEAINVIGAYLNNQLNLDECEVIV